MLTNLSNDLFKKLSNLEKIVLDGNQNLIITRDIFKKNLDKLRTLSMNDCNLKDLDEDLFDELT